MKTILVDCIHCLIIKNEGVFKEMYDLLETFPNRKIVTTGANDEEWRKFNLDEVPYEVFTLKHNPEKTDPGYYKKLLEKYNLTANGVIHFEHNPDAVKSAESIGIKSHYYNSDKKDLNALKAFLEKNLDN